MFPAQQYSIRPELLKPALMGWAFFLAELKTYRFRSGRGGRWRGGSDDGVGGGGEVVLVIEVVDIVVGI